MRFLRIFKDHYTTRIQKRKQYNQLLRAALFPQHAVPQSIEKRLKTQHIEQRSGGLFLEKNGGESGIRTHETLWGPTRSPGVRLKPDSAISPRLSLAGRSRRFHRACLLYTSDAADDLL